MKTIANKLSLARLGALGSAAALLLASSIARQRGDIPAAVVHAAKAFERNPNSEEILPQYSAMLGDANAAATPETGHQPADPGGRFSKRRDGNTAQSPTRGGKTALAPEVPRRGPAAIPQPWAGGRDDPVPGGTVRAAGGGALGHRRAGRRPAGERIVRWRTRPPARLRIVR